MTVDLSPFELLWDTEGSAVAIRALEDAIGLTAEERDVVAWLMAGGSPPSPDDAVFESARAKVLLSLG